AVFRRAGDGGEIGIVSLGGRVRGMPAHRCIDEAIVVTVVRIQHPTRTRAAGDARRIERVGAAIAGDRDGVGGDTGAAEVAGVDDAVAAAIGVEDDLLDVGGADLVVGVGRRGVGSGLVVDAEIAARDRVDVPGLGAAGAVDGLGVAGGLAALAAVD